ncbi:MAG: M61 family metallopeptidase [Flavobacteriales bacterium]
MIRYDVYCDQPQLRYIKFKARIPVKEAELFLELASWRPGRYELGNFAKNIKGLRAFNDKNERLALSKTGKDTWKVDCEASTFVTIEYSYYAAELNAGSSYLDEQQLYINPVNCFIYAEPQASEGIEIQLHIPENYAIAAGVNFENNCAYFADFDTLADSPFICSAQIERRSYTVQGLTFHVCFNNQKFIPWEKVLTDFEKFTEKQLQDFGEFPVKEFTFLIQSLPYAAYHGVEHLTSTVITLGPSADVFTTLYDELLGVSSHELYHVWNIKSLRPAALLPYNFKQENYSEAGFIYEGITTYMGDLYLLKSGVFSLEKYLKELSKQVQKHLDNPARFSMSVAQASFDTWLDGYVPGAPGRKVSIYTEGCLLAFYTDMKLRQATQNKVGLETVMKQLYFEFACQNKGYTIADYQRALENFSGISFTEFFKDFVFGTAPYEQLLTEASSYFGLELAQKPATSYAEARFGMKTMQVGKDWQITHMYPGSPAELGGLAVGDLIIAVNDVRALPSLDNWLSYHENQNKTLLIERAGRILNRFIPEVDRNFYALHSVVQAKELNVHQEKARNAWMAN